MSSSSKTTRKTSLYRNPRVLVLGIDAMLIMLGFGIVAPSMSYYLIALEGGLTQPPGPGYIVPPEVVAEFSLILGVMMAAFMGTRTLLARYWGGMSDTYGRRPIILIGLVGYVLLLVLFGLTQDWIQMLAVRAFQGVVSAMVWPTAEAALMDTVGPLRRGEGMGLYMVLSNIGFVLGPGVGGLLYNYCRDFLLLPVPDVFRVPYFIGALIVLPAVFATVVILRETAPGRLAADLKKCEMMNVPSPEITHPFTANHEIGDGEITPKRQKMIYVLYVMSAVNGIAMGLGQPIFQLFLMSRITTDIGLIGLVISGAGAVGLLFSVPAGRYSDRRGRKGLAVWGAVGARASLAILPLTTDLLQTSAVWIGQSAAMSSSQPAMRAIQADIVPWNLRGKLFGTIQAFFNAGATVGPIVGGALFAYFSLILIPFGPLMIDGIVVPFWLASVLGIIGAFLIWRYIDETRPIEIVKVDTDEVVADAT
jgi:DHA1 family multidrug resistance protein-like MFS transporter